MNREIFANKLDDMTSMPREKIDILITESINNSKMENRRGNRNLIICIEELSELSKEITKHLRGHGDYLGVLEELADVQIAIYYIQQIVGISDDMLAKAISVKIERLENILKRGNEDDDQT